MTRNEDTCRCTKMKRDTRIQENATGHADTEGYKNRTQEECRVTIRKRKKDAIGLEEETEDCKEDTRGERNRTRK